MNYKYNNSCGPTATDSYDDYQYFNGIGYRDHSVSGTGIITGCRYHAKGRYKHHDTYVINNGITELGDKCFNNCSIISVSLPSSLTKIGNECFLNSNIKTITFPDSIEEIGHNNFPSSLEGTFTLPPLIKDFPIDNISDCANISISVSTKNTYYTVINGILYNKDVTIALFCPRTKSGKVVIPDTVKIIGDYCFKNCQSLSGIEIPCSVETIKDYAFSDVKLKKLIIPNSVKELGTFVFYHTEISEVFKLSSQVSSLPDSCFKEASIPDMAFLKNITIIGNSCFTFSKIIKPHYLDLSKVTYIGKEAFRYCINIQTIELSSSIQNIGDEAFVDDRNMKLLFMSYSPIKIDANCFVGMEDDTILYVPKGSKVIFEKAHPWNIPKIEEIEINTDISSEEDSGKVSDEKYYKRLLSVANSLKNADRAYLQNILSDLMKSYLEVDTDEEYGEFMELLRYNNLFTPAIIHGIENEISKGWTNKYKLRLAEHCLLQSSSKMLYLNNKQPQIESSEEKLLSVLPNIETSAVSLHTLNDVEIHFDNILLHLQNELASATSSIKIAVSWFTNYSLFKQIKELAEKEMDIQLIVNNDSVNNGGYCLDLNILIQAGVRLSLIQYPHLLHDKFCIIDESTVINGSYNWSRFSANNYENVIIIRNNNYVTQQFNQEFDRLLAKAELKDIVKMPEFVPQRPEYDRYAFKQYITEELDAMAKDVSEERDKITVLDKASILNSDYLKVINPDASMKYSESFKAQEKAEETKKDIVNIIMDINPNIDKVTPLPKVKPQPTTNNTVKKQGDVYSVLTTPTSTTKNDAIIDQLRASSLFMAIDVSGSMSNTFNLGHVHVITLKVLSAALAFSDSKEVSLWTFGEKSDFIENIGVENIDHIKSVKCKSEGTNLSAFVNKASSKMLDNSLVIIFTDDDSGSIRNALPTMKTKSNVYWQIIAYETNCSSISQAILGICNISLITLSDYVHKTDSEITRILLNGYLHWRNDRANS